MNLNDLDINEVFGGHAEAAVEQFGSPTYLIDEKTLRSRAALLKQTFSEAFSAQGITTSFSYASKALITKYIARTMAELGYEIDACTMGEMMIALEGGVSGTLIALHGNNKSDEEIQLAIEHQTAAIIIDAFDEIPRIVKFAAPYQAKTGLKTKVMLRVTTGIHAGGHSFISTAHEDQKFGISIADNLALDALLAIESEPSLTLLGAHSHIGSQIVAAEAFVEAARILCELRRSFAERNGGKPFPSLDLGGGFGVQYSDRDDQLDIAALAEALAKTVAEHSEGLSKPHVSFEPGRWIIGPSGATAYKVGTVKDVVVDGDAGEGFKCTHDDNVHHHLRKYVSVEGGMSDNIRAALYSAKYSALVPGKHKHEDTEICRVVGKHCESGDIIVDSCRLPSNVERDDVVVVPVTGAYGFSMFVNYNSIVRPALVSIKEDGEFYEIVPRQPLSSVIL